ncbi:MAG: universal stress protein [Gillisia sp.]|nr:universal stress protein [Gillisia sp.]
MSKKILIPTDFSKNSWDALVYALNLYRDEECTFYLLNAFQLYDFPTDTIRNADPGDAEYEKEKEKSESGLQDLLEGINMRNDTSNHHFEIISKYNKVIDAVRKTVKEKKIEFLIMGTKGENNPETTLYGSNAVDVIEKVQNCPVLVLPPDINFEEKVNNEIVFATNFKTLYNHHELDYLVEIAKRNKAAVRVLYVKKSDKLSSDQENNKKVLIDHLKEVVYTFHTLTHIKVAEGIHSFIESRESGMLALVNKKHGFFSSIFSRSLVKEIGYKPQVPILVLHVLKS